jgi:hypothetical protein
MWWHWGRKKKGENEGVGENCIMTGLMIRQILLMEDEMCGTLMRGGEQKLLTVFSL